MKEALTLKPTSAYIPALDGFRGLAILVVVISHYGFGHLIPGGFGVTLFFFISGFLITRLLIAEHHKEGRIDLKGFYIRRILRLYPALLLMVLASSLYIIGIGCKLETGELLSTLLYYRNYYMVYFRGDIPAQCTRLFDIVWSLAIEEHFYIVFPLLFIAFYKRRNQMAFLMLFGVLATLLWRLFIATNQGMNELTIYKIYHLTETRADAIMFGCLVSLILDSSRATSYLKLVGNRFTFAGAIAILFFTFIYRDTTFRETYRYSLQGIAMFLFIPAILYDQRYKSILKIFSTPLLITVGRLSYSIYLFHWFGVCVAEYVISPERRSLPWLATAIPLGLALTLISYNLIEKPMNRLRKRFGSNVTTAASVITTMPIDVKPVTSA